VLSGRGWNVTVVSLPGKDTNTLRGMVDSMYHNKIHKLFPMTMQTYMAATIVDALEHQIKPALAEGHIVLCDRFVFSTIAYSVLYEVPHEVWNQLLRVVLASMKTLEINIDSVFYIRRHNYVPDDENIITAWLNMYSNYMYAFDYIYKESCNLGHPINGLFNSPNFVTHISNHGPDITEFWLYVKHKIFQKFGWHELTNYDMVVRTKLLENSADYSAGVDTYKGH
jgi:hypothetical protein